MRQIIDATALDSWFVSARRDAQELLPHLVRRLIQETVPQNTLTSVHFRVGDQVNVPGYDGIVETTAEHPYVPQGQSVWEMGTGPAEDKLAKDFQKRSSASVERDLSQVTFVFVSPHLVRKKQELEAKYEANGHWKRVRIFDSDDMSAWLEIAPVTARWLARQMGIPVDGILGLDDYLRQELDARYGCQITPALLIGGRNDAQKRLSEWLSSKSNLVRIEGESIEESCAFIAAAILTLPEESRSHIESSLAFVSDPCVIEFLAHSQGSHFLVAMTPAVRQKAEALKSTSIRVLVPRMHMAGAIDASPERSTIKLSTIHRSSCVEALCGMGYTNQESNRIARESKGSLTAVLWMIAQEHDAPLPWANGVVALDLLPLLLVGQWNTENDQDRDVIAAIAGKSYEEVKAVLARWAAPAGPLILRGTVWDWLAWDYAWVCLCPFMSRTHITAISAAVETVLSVSDPKLELPAEDRWAATMHGKKHPYSVSLRQGLVGSVVLFSTKAAVISIGNGKAIAGNLVKKLLDGNKYDRGKTWLSLASLLPDLAEAAPDEYFQELASLQQDKTSISAFFEEGGVFGSSPHVYLLWALERLAWAEEFLSRATLALGDLAAVDPGGHLSNRPLTSLKEIFLPWHPHTSASLANRVVAIDTLYRHHPEVAWQLVSGLLPNVTSLSSGTAEPQWHQWKPDGDVKVTVAEYWQFVNEMVERLLQWVGSEGRQWKTLIESYNNLRMAHHELADKVLTAIRMLDPGVFNEADACIISDTVRSLLSTHREISDAQWAMTDEQLVPFEDVYSRFRPKDLLLRFKWLFTSWPRLPGMRDISYEEQVKLIDAERVGAAEEILKQGGIDVAISMLNDLERPDTLGASLAVFGLDQNSEIKFLRDVLHLKPLPDQFPSRLRAGFGYVGRKYFTEGDTWLNSIVRCAEIGWDSNSFANLAMGLPEVGPTWDKLEEWDREAGLLYWQRVLVGHLREKNRDAARAVSRLLEVGRPYRAIEVVGMAVGHLEPGSDKTQALAVPLEFIVKALQDAPKKEPKEEWFAPQLTMVIHHVESLLDVLEKSGVELGVLASIEWAWLAGLEHGRRGVRALEKALAEDCRLFIDMLKLVFRAEGEERRELSEADRGRATQAYRLLEAWRSVPGLDVVQRGESGFSGDIVFHNGTMDEGVFTRWVDEARHLARMCGREAICDSRIGHVLAFSPMGSDDAWPCEIVRNFIERIRCDELERGLETGVYNKRGVHTKVSEGKQELMLAKKFEGYSNKVRNQWPRTGAVLSRMSDRFKIEAKWSQEQEALEEFE